MKELEYLLENIWIAKEGNKDKYFEVKEKLPQFKGFLQDKAGVAVIQNKHLIKMEKIPEKAKEWMGILDFNETEQYVILSLLLAFLEDKEAGEQFILSDISEFIEMNYPVDGYINWNIYSLRKSFVKVLKFAVNLNIIKLNHGDEKLFEKDITAEVLYESTGISRYFIRNFNKDIMEYETLEDFENDLLEDTEQEKGVFRTKRVYKNLLLNPVVNRDGNNESDFDYMKSQTHNIAADFEKYLEAGFDLSKNCAMIEIENSFNYRDVFPGAKAISDIVLLFNRELVGFCENGKLAYNDLDRIKIDENFFKEIVINLKERFGSGWSSEYRNMSISGVMNDIKDYMIGFNMMQENDGGEIELLPAFSKYTGVYPKDYNE